MKSGEMNWASGGHGATSRQVSDVNSLLTAEPNVLYLFSWTPPTESAAPRNARRGSAVAMGRLLRLSRLGLLLGVRASAELMGRRRPSIDKLQYFYFSCSAAASSSRCAWVSPSNCSGPGAKPGRAASRARRRGPRRSAWLERRAAPSERVFSTLELDRAPHLLPAAASLPLLLRTSDDAAAAGAALWLADLAGSPGRGSSLGRHPGSQPVADSAPAHRLRRGSWPQARRFPPPPRPASTTLRDGVARLRRATGPPRVWAEKLSRQVTLGPAGPKSRWWRGGQAQRALAILTRNCRLRPNALRDAVPLRGRGGLPTLTAADAPPRR